MILHDNIWKTTNGGTERGTRKPGTCKAGTCKTRNTKLQRLYLVTNKQALMERQSDQNENIFAPTVRQYLLLCLIRMIDL